MQTREVKAKVGPAEEGGTPIEVAFPFDVPDNLDEAKTMYGESEVYDLFAAKLIINVQGHARLLIKEGQPLDKVAEACTAWKPDVKRTRSPADRVRAAFASMNDDERRQLLSELGIEL